MISEEGYENNILSIKFKQMNSHKNFSMQIMFVRLGDELDFQLFPSMQDKQTNKTSILGTLIYKGENK